MKLWKATFSTTEGDKAVFATSERKVKKMLAEWEKESAFEQAYSINKIDVPTTAERLAHWLTVENT